MDPKRLESIRCNLCESDDPAVIRDAGANGRIVRCRRCGLSYISPRPVDPLAIYTTEAYFASAEIDGPGYLEYEADAAVMRPYFGVLARQTRRRQPAGSLVELGCATGAFLVEARAVGYDVCGVEPSADAAAAAHQVHGLDVLVGTAETVTIGAPVSVVAAFQTIEHVPDPIATLRAMREWLQPGGLLVMTTPDVRSWSARVSGSRWFAYKPPEHLYYFSPATMRETLAEAGFVDVAIERDIHRYPPSWLLGRLARYAPATAPATRLVTRLSPAFLLNKWSLPVHWGSMRVWARNPALSSA